MFLLFFFFFFFFSECFTPNNLHQIAIIIVFFLLVRGGEGGEGGELSDAPRMGGGGDSKIPKIIELYGCCFFVCVCVFFFELFSRRGGG